MSLPVDADAGGAFRQGAVRSLFQTGIRALNGPAAFNVSADGQRFLVMMRNKPEPGITSSVVVVTNWIAALKQ